jgi:APA family basic amino acid/polyamine antiporter
LLIAGIRTVFAVARGGWLPKGLSHVSKQDVPDNATWFVFILAMVILLAAGQKWLEALMTMAAITAGLIYVFVPVAALVLRKKHPNWTRPYKMPGWMGILATIFGLVILVATILGTPPIGWLIFAIFMAIGIIIFAWMLYKHSTDESYSSLKALSPEDIPAERE